MIGPFGTQLKAASMDVLAYVLGGIMCPNECVSLCLPLKPRLCLLARPDCSLGAPHREDGGGLEVTAPSLASIPSRQTVPA